MNTGEVNSIVGNQAVVKPTGKTPGIGATVYGENGKVGVVSDIIGAVDRPYAVVKVERNARIKTGDHIRLG